MALSGLISSRGWRRAVVTAAAVALTATSAATATAATGTASRGTAKPAAAKTAAAKTAAAKTAAAKTAAAKSTATKTAATKSGTRSRVRPDISLPDQPGLAGGFVAAGPTRLLDTRKGTGTNGVVALVGQNPLLLDVSGVSGNPSVTPTAVVLNVTVTNPSGNGYLKVFPADQPAPNTSNLNFTAGETVANLVTVPVGVDGKVAFQEVGGTADVVADLFGYSTLDKAAATYVADGPARILDTRYGTGTNGVKAPVGPGKSISLTVDGVDGIPTANVAAVVLNVTVTQPTTSGYLTVYPDGQSVPKTSNLNFTAGETLANLVTVPVGKDGKVDFYNVNGGTQIVADLAGYYVSGAPATGGVSQNLDTPTRILDTRAGTGTNGVKAPVGPGKSISVPVEGADGIPATDVSAVVLNVTVTQPTTSGYLTVYPDGQSVPKTSSLNFTAGETVPNLVVVPVGADGKVDFYNVNGDTQVVADVFGYFSVSDKLRLASLSFSSPTVDASAGGAAVTVNWTVTDTNPAATQTSGAIVIRQRGGTPGTYVGQPYVVDYLMGSNITPNGATFVSGDAASADYSYTFAVPRYAGATTATWAVSLFTAVEINTQAQLVLAGSALDGYGDTLTATELASTVTPAGAYVTLQQNMPNTPYMYDGVDNAASYMVQVQDYQSGIWQGVLTLSGPGGRTLSAPFVEMDQDGQPAGACQQTINDAFCYAVVEFPAGTAAGTWSVASLTATNNAGQSATITGLDPQALTVTSNGVVGASGFTATPNPLNPWAAVAPFTVSMRVSGARDGVASIVVYWDNFQCRQTSTTPTLESDGTYSVPMTMPQANNGQAPPCHAGGIAVTDGAGDLALYGADFSAPDPGLTVGTVPDTTPPVVTSAALNVTSIAQSAISSQSFVVDAQVSDKTAPVNQFNTYLYDSAGNVVGQEGGGASPVMNGTAQLGIDVPNGLAVGTYTIGFSVTDSGWLTSYYGMPGKPPVPGGPLKLTITAG